MKYTELDAQLTGRNHDRRKLANNTYAERRGEAIAIRLHDTDVLTFNPDGSIVATTGGWKTSTTKDRINSYSPLRIWQKSGRWFVGNNGSTIEFQDGLTIQPDGKIIGGKPESEAEAEKKLQKRIAAYCKDLAAALPLPKPGAGDCFYCMMREVETGKPLCECNHDTSHLDAHMEEKYFVPSLVWNALEFCGCKPNGGGCFWFEAAFGATQLNESWRNRVAGFVRKYIRRQYGLA